MDIYGWLKSMTQFSNLCGASPVNNYILFFHGHNSHFKDVLLRQIMCKNAQPFVIKSGDSSNDHPNDIGPNSKLKSLYNMEKIEWMMKYEMTMFSPHHMKSVLVEALDAFTMSSGNSIRDRFSKTKYSPSSLPT